MVSVSQATRDVGSCASMRVEDGVRDLVAHLVRMALETDSDVNSGREAIGFSSDASAGGI